MSIWTRFRWIAGLLLLVWLLVPRANAAQGLINHPDFLINHWLAGHGIPENSALDVAQTSDGYLWVASTGGLLRFNGREFKPAQQLYKFVRLGGITVSLATDRHDRLWVSTDAGMIMLEKGVWRELGPTNVTLRSLAEDDSGRVLLGTLDGRLYQYQSQELKPVEPPPGVTPSGMFCFTDEKDGGIWVVNRGFIGRWTVNGWKKIGPDQTTSNSVVAAAAHGGGVWVYSPGFITRYRDGVAPQIRSRTFIDQPRQMLEDNTGALWISTTARGIARVATNGTISLINATNGLTHNSARGMIEDAERNIWVGTSSGGLHRLRPRYFRTIGAEDGLPDRIVRTVTEEAPGRMRVGTHGGGTASIQGGKVAWVRPLPVDRKGIFAWSVLKDHAGRVWTGTYNDGLLVEENGVERQYPLPPGMGRTVYGLAEDSRHRVWVATFPGLGVIEDGVCRVWTNAPALVTASVRSMAEETGSGAMWIGTYDRGAYRLDGPKVQPYGLAQGLPRLRISSLAYDADGAWIGMYRNGMARVKDGQMTLLGTTQGLPAKTIGSILDDGLGNYWMGSDRGILRVSKTELHDVVLGRKTSAKFDLFNEGDGLQNAECSEGYQPAAARDSGGKLWFATLNGVVNVDPRAVRVNQRPPPVFIEQATFRDDEGARRTIAPVNGKISLPPGSSEIEVTCAALSFSAPEKVLYAYKVLETSKAWADMGNRREVYFHKPSPGELHLQVKAANNDGVWNETGAMLALTIQPYFWQTLWFRGLGALGAIGGGAGIVWQIQQGRLRRQKQLLAHERALAEEKARLASVLEGTTDFVGFMTPTGGLLYVNPAGRRMFGLTTGDTVAGLNIRDLHPPALAETLMATTIPQAVAQGTWSGESAMKRQQGGEFPVSQVMVAHKDAQGRLLFLSTIVRDITERKLAEAALRESEERYRTVVDLMPEGISLAVDEKISFANAECIRILGGKSAADIVGRSIYDFVPPELLETVRQRRVEVLQNRRVPPTIEAEVLRIDGTRVHAEVMSAPITFGGRLGVLNVVRDTSQRHAAALQMRQLEEQLRQSQKMEAIGQLAGGVAHDFNNILGAIMMQVDLARLDETLPNETYGLLDEIGASAARAANLTRQLLLFSRRQVMQPRLLDLNECVTSLAKMLQRLMGQEIRITLSLHPAPLIVHADAGMLDQILMNLAVNARDAMSAGGKLTIETSECTVTESEAQTIPEGRPGPFACVRVSDTGTGITPEIMPHIFEPFFTTKEPGKGTGLGLATVFGIVKQHQGFVTVSSQVNAGTFFRILLPLSAITDSPEAAPAPADLKPRGGTETIFLVEDEPAVRMATRQLLEWHGYRVLEAASGVEALQLWDDLHEPIHLLFTDLVMPEGIGGRELAQRLLTRQPTLKVLFTSGYSAELAGQELTLHEGRNFLQKPSTSFKMLETVRQCLDG